MCNRETGLSVMSSKHLNEDELTSSTLLLFKLKYSQVAELVDAGSE